MEVILVGLLVSQWADSISEMDFDVYYKQGIMFIIKTYIRLLIIVNSRTLTAFSRRSLYLSVLRPIPRLLCDWSK